MGSSYWDRRPNRRSFVGGTVLGLTAAGLAACSGSNSSNKSGTAPSPTRATQGAAGSPGAAPAGGSPAAGGSLIPAGLEKVYPLIAKYHWSKSTFSNAKPKPGGRLQLRLAYDTQSWDPFDPGTAGVQNVPMILFYNRLVTPNLSMYDATAGKGNLFQLQLQGDLAKSWEQPDKSTYIFHLNDSVKWFNLPPVNGRSLVANDVQYTYSNYKSQKSPAQADIFRDVDKFDAPDNLTFKMTTTKPVAYLINELSAPLAFVIAPEAKDKDVLKQDPPIGTGPWIMKSHTYRNSLQVDKNPNYFKSGLPYLDGIDFTWAADPTSAIAAYTTGKFDELLYAGVGGFDSVDQILQSMGWSGTGGKTDLIVQQQNIGGDSVYYVNVTKKPFDDIRVRRAVSMAVDRQKQLLTISGGADKGRWSLGYPTDWITPPEKPWPPTPDSFPDWYRLNQDMSKALLAQAGYKPGDLKLTLLASNGNGAPSPQLPLLQEDWKAVGIDVNIQLLDSVAVQSLFYTGKLAENQILGGVSAPSGLDLDDFTYRLMHSGAVNNQIGLADPTLDGLLDAQQAEFDRAARTSLGQQIAGRILDQVYKLWMTTTLFWEFKRPYVNNWVSHDVYMFTNGWALHVAENTWLNK